MSNWLWEKLVPHLQYASISISPRLRENTLEHRLGSKFSALLSYHQERIEASGFDRVVLVGHSGAGLLAAALGKTTDRVKHVVFIAANIPKNGTTAIEVFPEDVQRKNIEAVTKQAERDSFPVRTLEDLFAGRFCNQCTAEELDFVLAQEYIPEPVCVLTEKMNWDDYPKIGKTYILCTQDRTLTEKQQEYLASNLSISDIRRIDGDHMVMISRAQTLAGELNEIAESY